MKWFKTQEEKWEEKLKNSGVKQRSDQFTRNIETYKLMMYRNDIIKMCGREYIITGVDYHPSTYQYAGDYTYQSFAYWTISLKLIDDDPKMCKEITINIEDFAKYKED